MTWSRFRLAPFLAQRSAFLNSRRGRISGGISNTTPQKLVVVTNIIIGIVGLRSEHQQNRVTRIFVLDTPNHGRQIETRIRLLQVELLSIRTVVGNYGTAARCR